MSLTKVSYSMISGAQVNVLDFGADPTGLTDSTAAIQAAINYVESLFVNLGNLSFTIPTLVFPNGTYLATGLNISKPFTMTSSGPNSSIIKTVSDAILCNINISGTGTLSYIGMHIKGLSFIGNQTGANQSGVVFYPVQGAHVVEDCEFIGFGKNGFLFAGGATIKFLRNKVFQNLAEGAVFRGIETALAGYLTWSEIKSNAFSYNKVGMLLRSQVGSVDVSNNLFESNTAGSNSMGSSDRPSIGIKITKNPGGTDFESLGYSAIHNNYFEDNWIHVSSETMHNVDVYDNYMDSNSPSIVAFGASDGSVNQCGNIYVNPVNSTFDCMYANNYIALKYSKFAVGQWSVFDATTIKISTSTESIPNLIRYNKGSYINCGDVGVVQAVTSLTVAAGVATITVASTASFTATKELLIYIPQFSGTSAAHVRNQFLNNKFDAIPGIVYTDPDLIDDGQSLVRGSNNIRGGCGTLGNYTEMLTRRFIKGALDVSGETVIRGPLSVVNDLAVTVAGKGLSLTSPDGLVTKIVTINNAGVITLI